MKLKVDDLGVVGITVDDWSFEKSFKPKTIVTDYLSWKTYISRRAVPKHIELENTYYWKPILKPYGDVKSVQSDWNQDDENQPDYIKNKPNVETGGDKPYDPEAHSGLGRKTLELDGDSNILTQDDFDQENTIYVITYDFDLNGQNIVIPEGCTLDFEGGSINNGNIIGKDTYVNSSSSYNTIFGTSLTKQGTIVYATNDSEKAHLNVLKENLVSDTFNDSSWQLLNCAIEGEDLVIDNRDYTPTEVSVDEFTATTQVKFVSGRKYAVVCFAKIDDLQESPKDPDKNYYTCINGIGFRIGNYAGDPMYKPFIGMGHEMDYTPILYTFTATKTETIPVSFGCLYFLKGYTVGSIKHAGVYDVTDVDLFSYKAMFDAYSKYRSDISSINPNNTSVIFPDTLARDEFVAEMNRACESYGMQNSRFCIPSGTRTKDYYDFYHTYYNGISEPGVYYTPSGTRTTATARACAWVYDNVKPNTTYFIKNFGLTTAYSTAFVVYFDKSGNFIKMEHTLYTGNKYDDVYVGDYKILKVPENCSRIIVNSSREPDYDAPVLLAVSEYNLEIGSSPSVVHHPYTPYTYENMILFRPNDNLTTARDMACIGNVFISKPTLTSLASIGRYTIKVTTNDGVVMITIVNPASDNSLTDIAQCYSIIGGKGGDIGSIDTVNYLIIAKDKETEETVTACCIKMGVLSAMQQYILACIRNALHKCDIPVCSFSYAVKKESNGKKDFLTPNAVDAGNNENILWFPASVTKLITAIIAADYENEIENFRVEVADVISGSGYGLGKGDTLSFKDSLIALLFASDNTVANAIGRTVGQILLRNKYIK